MPAQSWHEPGARQMHATVSLEHIIQIIVPFYIHKKNIFRGTQTKLCITNSRKTQQPACTPRPRSRTCGQAGRAGRRATRVRARCTARAASDTCFRHRHIHRDEKDNRARAHTHTHTHTHTHILRFDVCCLLKSTKMTLLALSHSILTLSTVVQAPILVPIIPVCCAGFALLLQHTRERHQQTSNGSRSGRAGSAGRSSPQIAAAIAPSAQPSALQSA